MEAIRKSAGEKTIRDAVYNKANESDIIGGTVKDTAYISCIFDGFTFSQVSFRSVRFEKCSFLNSCFTGCRNLATEGIQFHDCEMANCSFTGCNNPGMLIYSCNMHSCSFTNCYLRGIRLIGDDLDNISFANATNLMDCRIDKIKKHMEIQFVNEKSTVKLNYGSNVGSFNYSDIQREGCRADSSIYINISNTYMDFAKQFEINNIPRKYGDCFYKCRQAMHFTLEGKEKAVSYIYDMVCGYGEKPWRAFLTSIIVIVLFAAVHSIIGINTSEGIMSMGTVIMAPTVSNILKLMLRSVYFSTVTFATVGYGDFLPVGIPGEIAAVLEIIAGIVMVGIWTSTLVRKITR